MRSTCNGQNDGRRRALNLLFLLALGVTLVAGPAAFAEDKPPTAPGNEPGKEDPEKKEESDPAKEEPAKPEAKEPPVFKLSDKDRKKVAKELSKFLLPAKKGSSRATAGIDKLAQKKVDGHINAFIYHLINAKSHAREGLNPRIEPGEQ